MESRFRLDYAPIIVAAEGQAREGAEVLLTGEKDAFGHVRLGGVGDYLAREIESRTGKEARTTVLVTSSAAARPPRDRWLATRFGLHAIDAVAASNWGMMTAPRGTDIVIMPRRAFPGVVHSQRSVRAVVSAGRHPKKSIAEALRDAHGAGLEVVEVHRGHRWGAVRCAACGIRVPVWSSPRVPEHNAERIRKFTQRHRHAEER